jgi:hypothetical protein
MLLEIISKNQLVDGILLPFLPEAMEIYKKSDISFSQIVSDLDSAYTGFLTADTQESRFEAFTAYGFSFLQGLVYLVHYPYKDKLESLEVRSTYFTDLFIMFNRFLGRSFTEQQVGLIVNIVTNALEKAVNIILSNSDDTIDYHSLLTNFFTQLESK